MKLTQKYLDELTYEVIGSAIEVHKGIGSGLLESVYHERLKEELKHRQINFNCNNIFHEGQQTFVNEYFSVLPKE